MMRLWRVLISNKTKCFFVFLLSTISTACELATSAPQAIIGTATVQPPETPSATSAVTIPTTAQPLKTSSATLTLPATDTAIPVDIPRFWTENQLIMEENGYSIQRNEDGRVEIDQVDKDGGSWEVVKIGADGSGSIMILDNNYRGAEFTLSAQEAKRINFIPLNAGHDGILAIIGQDTGMVERMFLPNVDKNNGTEAGWVTPVEISHDPHNPTKVDSASSFHTRHILYSALLEKGAEPWPDDFPLTTVRIRASGQYNDYFKDKFGIAQIALWTHSPAGDNNERHGRSLGYVEVDTPEGSIINNIIEYKINDAGVGFVTNVGYSGDIRNLSNFFDFHIISYRSPLMLFQVGGNGIFLERGGVERMLGVEYLYYHDIDNKPGDLFPEERKYLLDLDAKYLQSVGTDWLYKNETWHAKEITDNEILDELERMILYPLF